MTAFRQSSTRTEDRARGHGLSVGSAAAANTDSASEQDERDEGEAAEHQERPVGDRQAEEGPVDLGAVAAALEDHGNGALEREGLDHPVEVAAAGGDLGRVPLQPALAGGDE